MKKQLVILFSSVVLASCVSSQRLPEESEPLIQPDLLPTPIKSESTIEKPKEKTDYDMRICGFDRWDCTVV